VVWLIILLVLIAGLWILSGTRFRHGSAAQRGRALVAAVLGLVCIYQPLASLGTLPLTGIAWPGMGLDSPSDFWLLFALVLWVLVWRSQPIARSSRSNDPESKLEEFDSELRSSRLFRRSRAFVALTAGIVVVASLLLLIRSSAFALRRPNPVDPQGRTVKPFDGLEHAIDYARAAGKRRMILWSDTRFVEAHRLYESLGFRRTGQRELHDSNDTVEYGFEMELQ